MTDPRARISRALGAALMVSLALLQGCWTHHPARPQVLTVNVTPIAAETWPVRDVEPVRAIYDATPKEVFAYRLKDGVILADVPETERAIVEQPSYTIAYKGLHARSLLRIYEEPPAPASPAALNMADLRFLDFIFTGFMPNASIVSSRTIEAAARRAAIEAAMATTPEEAAEPGADEGRFVATGDEERLFLGSGLPLRIPAPPKEPGAPKPRGLAIHLHAIAGNEYEPRVMEEFVARGWAVIDVKTQTSINSPVPEEWRRELAALSAEGAALAKEIFAQPGSEGRATGLRELERRVNSHPKYPRYREVQTRVAKLRRGGFDASREEDLPKIAAEIALELDHALAGAAYAVEAVLDYVDSQRPDLQDIPVVLIGFSAGALATPTAAARIEALQPGRLAAVIMVGGGANLFRVAQESTFTDGGLHIRVGEERAPRPVLDALSDLYLGASRLDPYHTAPLIAHLPVLQLHGSTDTWVPAACGELLYERLNFPERLVMSGGHEYLFYFLPGRAKWIADWAERTLAEHALSPTP